ncbi:RusA family crossover junction endodeoxyribonuclease [Lactobacillus bombicola]|uniref:RusA family crossover junction endodeoxyribonuclease n=1 Tax=Lactobacillus bombicola TaxID=1505723 RepID=A0ABX9LX11_9LACO|nr:RusA family crossover junction endodeoxyribonuclease [Lactobacillus bombicola]RHW49180.1 RusA family crossover junction endodeoxyribonuclease [Lactobacillus bombicola]RHW53575.1 RusA family crossover junction endodeoxyribonuclease [Lactobacillus bombicola]
MANSISFIIPGKPQGKARPRFTRGGKGVRTYTPATTQSYEDLVRYTALTARRQAQIKKPISCDMALMIKAYFEVPKSFSKKRRQECLSGFERPSKKPDSDNIAKIILDGLNPKMKLNHVLHKAECVHEGLYSDDRQVVELHVEKWYSKTPRVEIVASWNDGNGKDEDRNQNE